MFFQGQFGGSSYLAEKNWSPGKRVHSPLCGLEVFPTYRCYKKLLMFFQGPTVCFSRYREGRWSDEWGFIYPAGWVIQQEFPTPNPCLSLLYSSPPPAPFSLQSLGRFPFLLSISLSSGNLWVAPWLLTVNAGTVDCSEGLKCSMDLQASSS